MKRIEIMVKVKIGYYLVRVSDGKYFYISKETNVDALDKVAKKVLTDNNYKYWIDYCCGVDFNDNPCWLNVNCESRFNF